MGLTRGRVAVGPQQGRKAFMIRTIRPLDRPDLGLQLTAVQRLGLGDDQLILARASFDERESECSPD